MEYALLIALISVAVVSAMIAFSGGVQKNLGDSTSALQKAYTGK